MPDLHAIDPTASLVEKRQPNAQLVVDATGLHTKVVFLADEDHGSEKQRVEQYLKTQFTAAFEFYKPLWAKRANNQLAWEGLPEKGETIVLPFSRQQTNQQHAWLVERVFSADPIVTCKPLGDFKFDLAYEDPDLGIVTEQVTSVDEARDIQDLIHHKWTTRLPMRKVISDWAQDALMDGTCASVVKITHDNSEERIQQRAAPTPKINPLTMAPEIDEGGRPLIIMNAPEYRTLTGGETVLIENVPGDNWMITPGYADLNRAPWATMLTDPDSSTVRQRLSDGTYDLALPIGTSPSDDDIEAILMATDSAPEEQPNKQRRKATSRVDKQKPFSPNSTHRVAEVFFRWPIMTAENPDVIEIHELVADYHIQSGRILSCGLLDTWNGKRPFLDYFQRQRPNSYSGTCTTEDVAPFQRYASNLFWLQIQNMVMRNTSVIIVRAGTSTATFLRKRDNIRPNMVLEVEDVSDIKLTPLGTPIESIASEINFLKTGAIEMGLATQYDNATADLARVAAGAFAQQQDLAKMQPKMVYDNLAAKLGELALMYLQMLIQYAPEQRIPRRDPKSDETISRVIHLPRQMVTDEFQFSLTATASDQTPEAQFQQDVIISDQIDKKNDFAMEVLAAILKPGTLPPFQKLGMKMIKRSERMLKSMLSNAKRHNEAELVLSDKELNEAMDALNALAGGMNAGPATPSPDAGPGGSIPPGVGGQQPQLLGSPEQPGDAGMAAPLQDAGLPAGSPPQFQ